MSANVAKTSSVDVTTEHFMQSLGGIFVEGDKLNRQTQQQRKPVLAPAINHGLQSADQTIRERISQAVDPVMTQHTMSEPQRSDINHENDQELELG